MPNPNEVDDEVEIDRGDDLTLELDDKPDGEETDSLGAGKLGEDDDIDAEGEETPEEKAEREAAEAEAESKKRIRIPKARFDEAIHKARQREEALKQEIAELRTNQQRAQMSGTMAEVSAEIESLQDKYEDLILDGMKDEARKVRRELDAKRDILIDMRTTVKSEQARKSAIEELQYDAALASLEAKHAELNPESPAFDAERTDEVAVLLEAFVARGFTRQTALTKAVRYVMGDGATSAPAPTGATRAERDAEARRRAALANARQPADSTKVGRDSDRGGKSGDPAAVDVMKMSQERFAKLDEELLSKMRGDTV